MTTHAHRAHDRHEPEGVNEVSEFNEDEGCGYSWDHEFRAPEYVDGMAVLVCRECGAEIFEEEPADDETDPRATARETTEPEGGGHV